MKVTNKKLVDYFCEVYRMYLESTSKNLDDTKEDSEFNLCLVRYHTMQNVMECMGYKDEEVMKLEKMVDDEFYDVKKR